MSPAPVHTSIGIGAEHFTRLVAQLPVIVWSTDTELHLTSQYGGSLAAFGHAPGLVDGPRVDAFVDPADAPIVHAAHLAALRGESSSYETRYAGRTFSSRVEPLCDAHGDVVGVVGFAMDVTDARRAEHALRESEARLRTIIETEPECVKLVDVNGRLLDMNPAGLAMIQAETIEAVRGAQIIELVAAQHRAAFLDLHRRVFAGESVTLEFEAIGLKGRRSWLSTHAAPLRDGAGKIYAALGITRDISRRKVAERALVESEQRFSKAFHANTLPLLITRLEDGQVLDANNAFLRLVNRERDDVLGQTTVSLGIIDPERRAAIVHALREHGTIADIELELVPRNGTPRTAVFSVVKIEIGGQQCALGTYRDVTEAKRAEEQLRASRAALRSLATREQDIRENERTRIAREIHDSLGQALTALKLQLSKESAALGGRLVETVSMVDDLVKSVRRIATELRPPILDQLGLPAALEWLAQDFSKRTGIRCNTRIHPTDGAVVDELGTALFRIVQEALTNVLRHAGATRVHIELGVKSGCIALEIDDDGSGITEAGTMGPGSLGILGMRERASALGGVLEVSPREGGGTRVAAFFPPPAAIGRPSR